MRKSLWKPWAQRLQWRGEPAHKSLFSTTAKTTSSHIPSFPDRVSTMTIHTKIPHLTPTPLCFSTLSTDPKITTTYIHIKEV